MGQYFYLDEGQFCNLPCLLRYLTPILHFYHIDIIICLILKLRKSGYHANLLARPLEYGI